MGAILVQLVPHSFTDFGDPEKVKKFLKKSASDLEEKLGVVTILDSPDELIELDYSYGTIGFKEGSFKVNAPQIFLRRDFWQIDYYLHYPQIVINYDGQLSVRDIACKIARALGANYSHYCDDYFIDHFDNIGDTFVDMMERAKKESKRYPAEFFRTHAWSEVNGLYCDHYDDYFEDIPE